MTEPLSPAPASPRSSPGIASRVARLAYEIAREIGWVLWQICLWLWRAMASAWSLLQQGRLRARRRVALRQLGDEIRNAPIPEHLLPLKDECDRLEGEVQRHRDAAAATGTGWSARAGSRIRLSIAKSARRNALRKLGESAIEIAPPAHRTALGEIEAAVAREQTRRAQLWQAWRALKLRRQAEVIGAMTVLVVAAGIFLQRRLAANPQLPPDNNVQNQQEPAPEDPAARAKKQYELADAFARNRKAAAAGEWVVYAGNPVLQTGELGDWDDFKVGAPIVIKDGDHFRMWYRACHFIMTDYTCGVGHAASKDGVLWEKSPAPVFVPENSHERERLDSLAIVRAAGQYWMWYSVRPDQLNGQPYATIHLATSPDGLSWSSGEAVLRALSEYSGSLEPAAYYDGKLFHLWYIDYPSDEQPAILHLTSTDGKQWQTSGSTLLSVLQTDVNRLSVVSDGHGGYRAVYAYTGRERNVGVFDALLSSDGNQWQRAAAGPKLEYRDASAGRASPLTPSVLTSAEGEWVWYALQPPSGAQEIGLAFLKGKTL